MVDLPSEIDQLGPEFGLKASNSRLRVCNLCLLLAVALGLLLRVHRIGSQGLWIDEAFSIWLARRPLVEMVRWVATVDQHPPLYYALLHGWIQIFGDGEAGVRALSALVGTLSIPVVYLLGRRLAGERVGVVGALILAVSPFHVRFSQEARMYALLSVSAALSLHVFVRLLDRRDGGLLSAQSRDGVAPLCPDPRSAFGRLEGYGRFCAQDLRRGSARSEDRTDGAVEGGDRRGSLESDRGVFDYPRRTSCLFLKPDELWTNALPWLGYVVLTAVALWTHNAAVLLPLALNLFVVGAILIQRRRGPVQGRSCSTAPWLRTWVLAQAAILLLWLPWLPSFISQAAGVYRRFWLSAPTLGTVLSVVGALLCDFLPLSVTGIVVVDVGLIVLALLGLWGLRRQPVYGALLGVVFLVPLAGEWVLSLWRPILYARTLIWTSIPLILLLAAGVCRVSQVLSSRIAGLLALVALLAVSSAALANYFNSFEKEQWDDAAALVAEHVQPDDLLLFNDTWGQIPFDYYFRELYNRPVVAHGIPADLFGRGVLEPEMTEEDLPRLRALSRAHERVWLVYSHDWYTDPQRLIPSALGAEMVLLNRWEFRGLNVFLYGH